MRKLFLLFVAFLATTTIWAYDFQSGDLYYNITSDLEPYTVEVTSYSRSYPYNEGVDIITATIPETVTYNGTTYSVTTIGDYAFYDCSSLTSVTIPNSVTSIGKNAFYECSSLTSVTIPNSVTSIGESAFSGCTSLTSVTIGNSVTNIGDRAFRFCRSLTSITIPNSVTSIGSDAFYDCTSLTSITIPNSVMSIGESAFAYCSSLTSMVVESGNSTYDSRDNCNAIIETASNTLIIGCQNTVIPNSVTSIGDDAFNCPSLPSITIPNSVTSIGNSAFSDCTSLTSMVVESGNSTYDSRENCNAIIETATNTLIAGCQNTVIPNSVTSIGEGAFYYCSSLTSVTIGNSVTSIGNRAFDGCSSLTSVTIGESVTSIGSRAFRLCYSLTSITIPNSVTSIGDMAFCYCSSLTSVTIPNSVTSIGNHAFSGCSSLTSITIGNSVTSIGEGAFYYCSSLTSVTIPNSVTSIGNHAFSSCSSITTVICEAINVPELAQLVFYNLPLASATLYVPAESLEDYKSALQWKDFGTILPIEENNPDVDIELQDTEITIIFTNSEDNDSEIYSQSLTLTIPAAPEIEGFTFLYWQPVAEPLTDVITIQAIYEANAPASAPEVYVNPANPAQKLLRNGQVYILQDGQTYTIQGQKL